MKRLSATGLTLIMLLTACSDAQPAAPTTDGSPATTTALDGDEATVVRVFDGDSMEVDLEGKTVEVRMLGINAPEGSECHGDVARDRLRELIDGEDVLLRADGEDTEDRFGRLLRTVYVAGESAGETMVGEGHALALQNGDPIEGRLADLSDQAFADRLGMWAPDACGESTPPLIRILDVEYDPPGRDWENREEEWIVILNDDAAPIDISGWILRDESSTHRYEFTNGEIIEPGAELRVRTGCGEDRSEDRYWCADDAVWSNGGDTVILQTSAGTVVDRLRYAGDY